MNWMRRVGRKVIFELHDWATANGSRLYSDAVAMLPCWEPWREQRVYECVSGMTSVGSCLASQLWAFTGLSRCCWNFLATGESNHTGSPCVVWTTAPVSPEDLLGMQEEHNLYPTGHWQGHSYSVIMKREGFGSDSPMGFPYLTFCPGNANLSFTTFLHHSLGESRNVCDLGLSLFINKLGIITHSQMWMPDKGERGSL